MLQSDSVGNDLIVWHSEQETGVVTNGFMYIIWLLSGLLLMVHDRQIYNCTDNIQRKIPSNIMEQQF